jgi:hypothetical protein
MRQLTVTMEDNYYNTFIDVLKQIPQISVVESESDYIKNQELMVIERVKNAKPEDYISWEIVKREMDEKWNFNGKI